jgi:putative protease
MVLLQFFQDAFFKNRAVHYYACLHLSQGGNRMVKKKAKKKVAAKTGKTTAKKSARKKALKKRSTKKTAKKRTVARTANKKTAGKSSKKKAVAKTRPALKKSFSKKPLAVKPGPPAVTPPPVEEPASNSNEEAIGVITHYYSHLGVAVAQLNKGSLKTGDTIHVKGQTTDFTQTVTSMEYEHQHVDQADAGQNIGLKVIDHAREHDIVYRVK